MIIKVFGHFPRRSRRGSWWHSCIPKHGGGNYNEAPIHSSDHKVCTWHRFRDGQAVVERGRLWPSLLQCRQCTLIYLGNHRKQWAQPNICFHRSVSGRTPIYCGPGETNWSILQVKPAIGLASSITKYPSDLQEKAFKRLHILSSVTSLTSGRNALCLQCMYICTPYHNKTLFDIFIFIFINVCMFYIDGIQRAFLVMFQPKAYMYFK